MSCGCGSGAARTFTMPSTESMPPVGMPLLTIPGDFMYTVHQIDQDKFTVTYPLLGTPGVSLVVINFQPLDAPTNIPNGINEKALLEILKIRLAEREEAIVYLEALLRMLA